MKASQILGYYGATIAGISAVFSAAKSVMGIPINSLFNTSDIADYKTYAPEDCVLCKEGVGIDTLANGFGYSRFN